MTTGSSFHAELVEELEKLVLLERNWLPVCLTLGPRDQYIVPHCYRYGQTLWRYTPRIPRDFLWMDSPTDSELDFDKGARDGVKMEPVYKVPLVRSDVVFASLGDTVVAMPELDTYKYASALGDSLTLPWEYSSHSIMEEEEIDGAEDPDEESIRMHWPEKEHEPDRHVASGRGERGSGR